MRPHGSALLVLIVLLAGCAQAATAAPADRAPMAAGRPPALGAAMPDYQAPAGTPAPLPQATPVPVQPSPPAASAPPQPPVVGQPAVRAGSFPLLPFGARGAVGSVMVSAQNRVFSVAVSARNLAPGSLHTVHLHAGSCAGAYLGRHILVLGTMAAGGAGAGSVSTSVAFPYASGRYVIVYSSLAAVTIIGCADLGPI
jgi:hypothetical protein